MAEIKQCAGCLREDETIRADSWCTECGEPVCQNCARVHKRLSPPHKVVDMMEVNGITSYLLKMSTYCENHPEEKLFLFCCQHDSIICAVCVTKSHKTCNPILSLKKAAEGVKQGTAITDLERRIKDVIRIMEENLKTRGDPKLLESKATIIQKVKYEKQKMINHLDKLEEQLMREIDETFSKYKIGVDETSFSLELPALRQLKIDLLSLRENLSDVHFFQVVKTLDKKVHLTEQEISTMKRSVLPVIQFTPSEFAANFINVVQSIGKISSRDQEVPAPTPRLELQSQASINTTEITTVSTFETSILGKDVRIWRGCFISSSRLLLSPVSGKLIYICNTDGSNGKSIKLDFFPQRIVMYDSNMALTSSGDDFIMIINLTDFQGKKIKVGKECEGMACRNGKIWIRSDWNTLTMVHFNGKVSKKITTTFDPLDICVHHSGDVYCTSSNSDSVYAVTPEGEERIIFSDPNLKGAVGIVIDRSGYIFLASRETDNIHIISPDAKVHSVVLTEEVGIKQPTGLAYNKITNELLVINDAFKSITVFKI